jgi:tetratricopeptide (TPR) repeat protein
VTVPADRTEPLERLLRAATVRVEGGARPGAGFFLAPGLVVTCAHVVRDATDLTIVWGEAGEHTAAGRPEMVLCDRGRPIPALDADYPDVAVLQVAAKGHPCVALDEDMPTFADRFRIYGFPTEGGSVVLTPGDLSYRGIKGQTPTEFIDLSSDRVKGGMSGAPLLNLRSRGVCGVMVATRSEASPDGGLAVPWVAVQSELAAVIEANRAFHEIDRSWQRVARPPGRRVRFRLPVVAAAFAGRGAELGQLQRALEDEDRALVTQTITGLGGVGKSQVAARYVSDHTDAYDVVAWIRAEDGGVADLADLAVELGVPVDGLPPPERADRAISRLGSCDERWLLVLDNVTDPELLEGRWPASGNGRLLVTSRRRDLDQFGAVLRVDVFDEETGARYLTQRAGRPGDDEAARRLARALGGLPLALSHAGAYCSAGVSFDDYIELLTELPAPEMFDSDPELFYGETVASTWKVSIEAAERDAELSRLILCVLSYLSPDNIPITLLQPLVADPRSARGRKQLRDAINALSRFSLIDVVDDRMNIHRLLQKTVRDDFSVRGEWDAAKAAVAVVGMAMPDALEQPASWPQCEQILPHILSLAETVPAAASEAALVTSLTAACVYQYHAGRPARSISTGLIALSAAKRILGDEHPNTLTTRANLASSYWSAGRTDEALAIEEELLRDSERIRGNDHPRTVTARANLAISYWSTGHSKAAITVLERVVSDSERISGENDQNTLTARSNLAVAYWSIGRNDDALALLEGVVSDSERTLGSEHPDTLKARGNLASSYWSAGRIDEALAIEERLLGERARILGNEHRSTLVTRGNLAVSYQSAGRTERALALFESVAADRERILGAEHPETLAARAELAAAREAMQNRAD